MPIFIEKEGVRDVSIRELLGRHYNFKVPRYQRGFCWDIRKEVSQFWDDIQNMKEKQEEYFFGSMIFYKEQEDTYTIIDGQQRIALVTILFIVIRDIYMELKKEWEASELNSEFIGKTDTTTKKIEKKLKLSNVDDEFFIKYILPLRSGKEKQFYWKQLLKNCRKHKEKVPTSNRLLYFAYDYLYESINDELKNMEEKKRIEFLNSVVKVVSDNFKIIKSAVKNESYAYEVFETLNERGKQLGFRDLLKTYLFSKAEDKKEDVKEVETKWDKICKNLNNQSEIIDDFLRHYLMSINGITRKREVFKKFQEILEKYNVVILLTELEIESKNYASLLEPSMYFEDKDVIHLLEDIKTLNVKLCYPLLLSGFCLEDKDNFPKLLEMILKFTFRYSTVCGRPSNKLERLYLNDISVKIRKKEIDIEQIKKILIEKSPSDDDFYEEFKNFVPEDSKVARYILREIEDSKSNREKLVNKDPNVLNLEHVMPLNPDPDCKKHLENKKVKIDDWNKMLGNLTLLLKKVNEKLENKCFKEKQKILLQEYKESSKLSINKEIFSKQTKDWTNKEIGKRQEQFVKIVKERKLWKID